MSGPRGRRRRKVTALAAAALCWVATLLIAPTPAAGEDPAPAPRAAVRPSVDRTGEPGVPLNLVAGAVAGATGLAVADLPNGANGPIVLTIGPCVPAVGKSCSGVLSEFSLIGSFKDRGGRPLYSDSHPVSVSWACNDQVCPTPAEFVRGRSTVTELQVAEFRDHTVYVALRNPNGTFQPFAPAPACQGTTGAPLPTGTIDRADTRGRAFCVDVGAISRANARCQTACSTWAGALTLPVLFVEDPKFMAT